MRLPNRTGTTRAVLVAVVLAVLATTSEGGARSTASSAAPRCAAADLVVWLDTRADGAAGSAYYRIEFTNLSTRTCTLRGYPGVSAVDLRGRQVGAAAARDAVYPVRVVTLRSGAAAAAVLRLANARNFPRGDCRPRTAGGLRVYPPGETTSARVPFPLLACARHGPSYLHVTTVR
jgi:Protein of unknown function (DUF4232)